MSETYTTSKRVDFIDQCKGIGILLMVYDHCQTTDFISSLKMYQVFTQWFTSFHMPLFFILGGCLIAYKHEVFSFPTYIGKKTRRLLLPGLFFSILSIMMFFAIKLFAGKDSITYLKNSFSGLITLQYEGPMWFLPCYFFSEIIFLIIMKRRVIRLQELLISIISYVVSVFLISRYSDAARISRLLMAICFISVGYWLYRVLFDPLIHVIREKRAIIEQSTGDSNKTSSAWGRERLLIALGG